MSSQERKNDEITREYKEERAIVISIIFLLYGLFALWFSQQFLMIKGDTVLVSLLILPVIIYMIISGRLVEFKGPGGWGAKFKNDVNKPIRPSINPIRPNQVKTHFQIVKDLRIETLEKIRSDFNEKEPIIMTIVVGDKEKFKYDKKEMITYLEALSTFRQFKFVVFLRKNEDFFAFTQNYIFKETIESHERGDSFINNINEGEFDEIKRYPDIYTDFLSIDDTNEKALYLMKKLRLEALIVVDNNKKLVGVIERDQILSEMMLSLIKYAKE